MTTTTRRRWSPVTEATLQAEFENAHDTIEGRRWPRDWFVYVTARAIRDLRTVRTTKEVNA